MVNAILIKTKEALCPKRKGRHGGGGKCPYPKELPFPVKYSEELFATLSGSPYLIVDQEYSVRYSVLTIWCVQDNMFHYTTKGSGIVNNVCQSIA